MKQFIPTWHGYYLHAIYKSKLILRKFFVQDWLYINGVFTRAA